MPVRSGSSAVGSGEETSGWSKYSVGAVTGIFMTSETKPQRLFIIVPWADVVLKRYTCLVVCSRLSPSDANHMSHFQRWEKALLGTQSGHTKSGTPSSIRLLHEFSSDGMHW